MEETAGEACGECGFASPRWRLRDAGSLMNALGYWWRLALNEIPECDLNGRPAPGVWSALEYGLHTSLVTAFIRSGVELILERDDCPLPAPPEPDWPVTEPVGLDPGDVVGGLEREGARFAALVGDGGAKWSNTGRFPDGSAITAQAAAIHAVHDATHHFMDVARGLNALRVGTPQGSGRVVAVNISNGGVPKLPIPEGQVTWDGIRGDRQADSKHHGRPFQAICLWSAEVIQELSAAGHSVGAGSAGENLTLAGLDWETLRPGARIEAGSAMLEVSFPATPCKKQSRWFSDGDFARISHDRNPRWARWYAWVRRPGEIRSDERVVLQP